MTQFETAMLFRDAGAVKRYHTCRTTRQQDLAAHTHGVVMLVLQVYPECSKHLLIAAMHHDLPELITGDIPAPAKRMSAMLAVHLEEMEKATGPLYCELNLTTFEECVLKWCDTFELVLFCLEELLMGNMYALSPLRKGLEWCQTDHAAQVLRNTIYTSSTIEKLLEETVRATRPFIKEPK